MILVVDSDRACREHLAGALQSEGYGVVPVEGGGRAIELLEAGLRPAAITLELDMPAVDGHALLRHVRCRTELKALSVVVVSSRVRRGQHVPWATAVLSKPVDLSVFLETIRTCIPTEGGEAVTGGG